ncbi:MAG: autotransporter-associated N-terminal domain-containing protein [Sebaldella sp.]|nr:autotransporter-associated N-terminal domain-containing protein [Sebaldella sp.]
MKNILAKLEKDFKSKLKNNRKISYSSGLVLSILLTGGISTATETSKMLKKAESITSNEDLSKVAGKLREEIRRAHLENEEKLKNSDWELWRLEQQGDQVIKSPFYNYLLSTLGEYRHVKTEGKDWKYGSRSDTAEDLQRNILNEYLGISNTKRRTSGWITETNTGSSGSNAWDENTKIYDHTAVFTTIPSVNIPLVTEPIEPEIVLSEIVVPNIPAAPSVTIQPITVNVTAPTVTAPGAPTVPSSLNIAAPADIVVSTFSPNINIEVSEVKVPTFSDVAPPNLEFTAPTLSVSPQTTPTITPPTPTIKTPSAPTAPNFKAFNRGRGEWLGGFTNIRGVNSFDRKIKAWEQGLRKIRINDQPMFNVGGVVQGHGKGSSSTVMAVTNSNGVVTNKYDQIQIMNGAPGGTPTNQYGPNPFPIEVSPVGFAAIAPGQWVSAEDNDTLQGFSTTRYQQKWLFQGTPIVQDMNIIIGGSTQYTTAIFAQFTNIRMNRVAIELRGSTIIGQLDIRGAYNVEFKDLDINITGNSNSILTTYSASNVGGSPSTVSMLPATTWGKAHIDNVTNSSSINFGGTSLTASTSENTIFYVASPSINRWTGASVWYPLPGTSTPVYQSNSEKYLMYAPVFGNVKVENTNGNIGFTGSSNVGVWVTNYVPDRTKWAKGLAPELDLGIVELQGDKNVAYYLAGNNARPDKNAVFQGNIKADIKIGTNIDGKGGVTQIGTGNIGTNDNKKSEDNVGIYVGSGQRAEMNNTVGTIFQEYFPATLDFKVDTAMYPNVIGIADGTQIGYSYLTADPIKSLKIKDFETEFGKFSKNGIALVAKNGTVIDINKGSLITDNAGTGADRAEGTTMFYAEGVWYNPRKAMTTGVYDKEAYGRGESQTGKKNIADFNTEINIADNIVMSSYEGVALFAKDGGKINAKDISMDGYGSIGAFASGVNDLTNTILSDNTGAGSKVDTVITVDNISALGKGTKTDLNDGTNDNIGVAAITVSEDGLIKGTGSTTITVLGDLTVNGVGAFAKGDKAVVNVQGTGSTINTGVNGALVALQGGKVNFSGGTIEHKSTWRDLVTGESSHDGKLTFYADDTAGSNINFNGSTVINMHNGVAFYGDTNDYSATNTAQAGETGKYTGMNNVTINLQDNGVNLGVFKNLSGLVWDSSNSYLNGSTGLKNVPKVAGINPGSYWYSSSLDGGSMVVRTDVNRDNIVSLDSFNKIIMERVGVTLDSGYTIKSTTDGNGLVMGSNSSSIGAPSNTESGYTIKGTVDIASTASTTNVGAYVSFGHILTDTTGKIKVDQGVGAYGVNGSKIENKGSIEITEKADSEIGIGIAGLSTRVKSDGSGDPDTPEIYGTDNTAITSLLTAKVIDISNEGKISVYKSGSTLAKGAVGIYVDNNAGTAQNRVSISNSGTIELGAESAGIQIKGTNGGELTLKTNTVGITNIKVGANGVGILAENSSIKFDGDYKFDIGLGGIALEMNKSNTHTLVNNPTLTIINDEIDTNITTAPTFATGIYYDRKEGDNEVNNFNLTLTSTTPSADKSAIIGLYIKGKETTALDMTTLTNTGNISAGGYDYGIYADKTNVLNTGNVSVGANGTGIVVMDGKLTTADNLISVTGKNGVGLYIKGVTANPLSDRELIITDGSGSMNVTGDEGVGIFAADNVKVLNSGQIVLSDSATATTQLRKTGMYLEETKKDNELTSTGLIAVGKDNIGVYGLNSKFKNNGQILVNEQTGLQNIGIYTKSSGTSESFDIENRGIITVNGQKSIGIYASSEAGNTGSIKMSTGAITVNSANPTSATNIPLGVYVKGDNINVSSTSSTTTVGENAVGIYLDGRSTLGTNAESFTGKYDLSSANSKLGVGAYLKGGAQAENGTITIKSTASQGTGTAGVIRPIGLLYAKNTDPSGLINGMNIIVDTGSQEIIGLYTEEVAKFKNTGNLTLNAMGIGGYFKETQLENRGNVLVNADSAYGLYVASDGNTVTSSSNYGQLNVNSGNSVGLVVTNKAEVSNSTDGSGTGTINSNSANGSIGVYATNQGKFINDIGAIVNSTQAKIGLNSGSIGIVAKGGLIENRGIINSENIGVYGTTGTSATEINHTGTLNINSGTGIYLKDTGLSNTVLANLNGGTIKVALGVDDKSAVVAEERAKIVLNGTDITVNDSSNAIALMGDSGKKSTLEMKSGNIKIGSQGVGIYSKESDIFLDSGYTGTIELGEKSTGIYVDEKSNLSGTGTINIKYVGTDKGTGIFYKEGIRDNKASVNSGALNDNLINIYGENLSLTNSAEQVVGKNGIGIYVAGTTSAPSIVTNNAELKLNGEGSMGIYAKDNTTITSLGTISGSNSKNDKIGVFLDGGDITGTLDYTFEVDGGIGIYMKKYMGYSGQMRLTGTSYNDGVNDYRAIGILVDKAAGTGTLAANLEMSGANGIGIYLDSNNISGPNLTYTGQLDMNATSGDLEKGIGVYVNEATTFNLGTGGAVNIAGDNNIGFYVADGGTLNIGNGSVTNTENGIFAYLAGGNMTFAPGGSLGINYVNIIAASGGSLINHNSILTGKSGLQATGGIPTATKILNDVDGIITSHTLGAVAIAGEDGADIENAGRIVMTGDGSIGFYTNGATALSSGTVEVKDNSIAYYAKDVNNKGTVLTISSGAVTTLGNNSILLAADEGGKIDYQGGHIILGDNKYGALIGGANSSNVKSEINFHNNDITVGKESVAVILKEGGEINSTLGNINLGEKGVGIYSMGDVTGVSTLGRTINLGLEATGIYSEKGTNTVLSGNIQSSSIGAKGIVNKNKTSLVSGSITNNGNINLLGNESIGIYGENLNLIENLSGKTVEVGDSTLKSSVGIYGENTVSVRNDGNILFGSGAVGIYGKGINSLVNSSTGIITNNNKTNGTGMYAKDSLVENRGQILLGDTSNGIYTENGLIDNYGDITVGNYNSSGIYGSGTTNINHNSGTIKIGSNSVGLATINGNIVNNGTLLATGEETTYIYSKNGNALNNNILTLSDYSVGMYGQNGIMTNNGTIEVGKSDVDSLVKRFSVGMYTETGKIVNNQGAVVNVSKEAGVGMFASGIEIKDASGNVIGYGESGTAENHGIINVTGDKAYGIQAINSAKVYNGATGVINVAGTGSKGIAATSYSEITNEGIINVSGTNTQGIYIDRGASFNNIGSGQVVVSGVGNTGVYIGTGGVLLNQGGLVINSGGTAVIDGGGSLQNIGKIVINGPTISFNGVEITNVGTIQINGKLEFTDNILLNTIAGEVGKIEVEGLSGKGNIILSPGATQGTNHEVYQVQLLDGLGANIPSGELSVISQSVSFIGEKYYDSSTGSYVFTLTKIPYMELLQNTEAVEFGKGLDQLYGKARGKELEMFDAMDMISNKDELAETFDMELRGNIYANIQQRMMDVNSVFESAYKQLKSEDNRTKKSSKITAIYVNGNASDSNPGVEDYDYQSTGIMYLNEKEEFTYGKTLGYSLGFVQSKFDFDRGSKEDVSSLKAGIGYEQYLNKNSKFKFVTRGELGLNYHDTEREIVLSNGTYKNDADYFSGTVELKNQLRYDFPIKSNNMNFGVYGSFNLGYGKYQGFTESGDGIYLDVKSEDYYSVRPGVGVDGEISYVTGKGNKLSLELGASYEYEFIDPYGDGNQVKIKDTTADYYRLEAPKDVKNILKGNIGVGYEINEALKIGAKIEQTISSTDETKYQLGLTWKF